MFKGAEMVNGKMEFTGWKFGSKQAQRLHQITRNAQGIFVSLDLSPASRPSDNDTMNENCGKQFKMHAEVPELVVNVPT